MIIWSGWGVLVVVFALAGLFIGYPVAEMLPVDKVTQSAIGFALTGAIGGLGCFLFDRYMRSRPGRVFIDEQSGQRIKVGANAGSLFFIPVRFWAFILPVIGIGFAALAYSDPNLAERDAPTPQAAPAASAPAADPTVS